MNDDWGFRLIFKWLYQAQLQEDCKIDLNDWEASCTNKHFYNKFVPKELQKLVQSRTTAVLQCSWKPPGGLGMTELRCAA